MSYHTLRETFIPELGTPRKGKVRDIYENGKTLALISSDRVSIFDRILEQPIQDKGKILTELSLFWFEKTKDIIQNHIISHPDPNVIIVKKCEPIMVEMIVRGYLVGSMWRDYAAGKRTKCGIAIPESLKENDPLPTPIVTPTTKSVEGHDEDITKEELIQQGIVSADLWNKLEKTSLELYQRGQEIVNQRGMILVDTKYEFGLDEEDQLVLIDEIHTPDSSRYWYVKDVERKQIRFPDKEFVREWGRSQGFTGDGKVPVLPEEIMLEVSRSYKEIYHNITGQSIGDESFNIPDRLICNLRREKLIKGVYCHLVLGSEVDRPHAEKITKVLEEHGIPHEITVASAHKNTKKVIELIDNFNQSLEPVVFITIAGRSNALSGVFAANTHWPVIACPPFKDKSDYLVNIHSTLQMPSNVPVLTVIEPENAALAAMRILKVMEVK
ncbi:MAG: Phosphoribosylaminoimidazole-succinocarboxamide synthase [Chlamydiae bacterium]|nr:Phosphoribosylaminoimidazole-succinocarboxamide synthase [Chlamydiota bacterium]